MKQRHISVLDLFAKSKAILDSSTVHSVNELPDELPNDFKLEVGWRQSLLPETRKY